MLLRFGALGAMFLFAAAATAQKSELASGECADCHASIAESFRKTGMGRSYSRPSEANRIEDYTARPFYHAASNTYFENIRRGGRFLQRQYQIGPDGRQLNITESQIDYIMGSGNHARTYLHRTGANELVELPLGWYAESGGYWAMNPGYDRPDHAGLSRSIPYGCMFCHNGYPQVPPGTSPRAAPAFQSVPEGIDCQRCHGDGARHVRLARLPGSPAANIRAAIVNSSRLPPDRRIEICLQCHMEPKSSSVASLIVRYEREPFSYKPGEALSDFRLHFDQSPAGSAEGRFEIVGSSSYRLLQSQCFLQSKSALTCTTCHDPHRELQAQEAASHFSGVCLQCHSTRLNQLISARTHTADRDCVPCHMPKRRTQDAVHVVMTDHLIQRRRPSADLTATRQEDVTQDSTVSVRPYYPGALPEARDELYLGVAQVNERSTRSEGIERLASAIKRFRPESAEYYLQLGDALRASRRFDEAIAPYREAVRREPLSAAAHERLAFGLTRVSQFKEADEEFGRARLLTPNDANLLKDIGISYLEQGRFREAVIEFQKALNLNDTLHEAHNGLGGARLKTGDIAGSEAEFRKAIQLRPHYAEAQHNLAYLLYTEHRFAEARYYFEESLRTAGNNTATRFDFAMMLFSANLADEAENQLAELFRTEPNHVKALDLQGRIWEASGRRAEAITAYRKSVALDPKFARGSLDLGAALARSGDSVAARLALKAAAESTDSAVRTEAAKLLQTLGQND